MFARLIKYAWIALLMTGSAILLYSCEGDEATDNEPLENIKTEESENLTIVVSENGRRSYRFKTPLLEGYTLGRDPYREFCKGIDIITYQDDSMSTVNATLTANYAIYYENRKLWEAKGNVVVTKADGTKLYTQQLFWNSLTKRIFSNVDTKVVTDTDTFIGEGFESDEDLKDLHFRRFKSKMLVDNAMPAENADSTASARSADTIATGAATVPRKSPAPERGPGHISATPQLSGNGNANSERESTKRRNISPRNDNAGSEKVQSAVPEERMLTTKALESQRLDGPK